MNGLGFGLIISELIVREFGGKMSVESEKDVGSIFRFYFKLNPEHSVNDSPLNLVEIIEP